MAGLLHADPWPPSTCCRTDRSGRPAKISKRGFFLSAGAWATEAKHLRGKAVASGLPVGALQDGLDGLMSDFKPSAAAGTSRAHLCQAGPLKQGL